MRQLTKAECKLLNEAHDLLSAMLSGFDEEDWHWACRQADQWLDDFKTVEEESGEFWVE